MDVSSVGMGYGGVGNAADQASTTTGTSQNVDSPEVVAAQAAQGQVDQQQPKVTPGNTGDDSNGDKKEATDDQIKKAVSEINKRAVESEAVFGIHEKTNRITIKIVDKKTKDVIKEIPAEKTLDLIAKVWEMAGLMVDEKR